MAEPILWANHAANARKRLAREYNPKTKELDTVIDDETGEPVFEKVPQRGHGTGDPIRDNIKPLNMARWVHYLKACGNEARVPVTNSAAQQDPDTKYKQFMTAKARHFGWIPVGQCPMAMFMTGGIRANQLADKALKENASGEDVSMCQHGSYGEQKPCKHYIAERTARRKRKGLVQAKRDRQFQGDADKQIEAQREENAKLVQAVAAEVAKATSKK